MFAVVLVSVGIGVWVGVTTAGSGATPWIKGTAGAVMMIVGGLMFVSRDAVDRRKTQLFGAGYFFLGVSQFVPSGRWSITTAVVALGCMVAALGRSRRAGVAAPSAK